MSGLTDALLEELIEVEKINGEQLKKLVAKRGAGGGSGGGDSDEPPKSLSLLGSTANKASTAIGALAGVAAGVVGIAFTKLISTGQTLWQNQMALAEGAIEGTNSLSSLTAGLENLPFGLGLVAQAMNYQTRVLEKNIATFQQMSQSGATLGGNLDQVRRSAAGMYLSMDEFSKLMQESTPILRYLGGTSEEGARNLIKFNTGLIQGNVGKQLLSMGYTLEEVNGMLGSYASVVGGVQEGDVKNQKRMEQSVKNFAQELDLSAQLEGKTRKQKEEELKKAAAQAAVEAKLAGMTAEQKDKYAQALAAAQREGQGAVDALHSEMLGFPPMTKAAQMYTAVVGDGAAAQRRNAQIVNDNSTAAESRSKIDRNAATATAANIKAYEDGGAALQAATWSNGALADQAQQSARSVADSRNKGIRTEEDALKRINETRAAQEEAQRSGVGATVQAQGQMKHFGGLMEMLSEALAPLFPVVTALIQGFAEILPKVLGFAKDVVEQLIVPLFKGLFGDLNMEDIIKPFKDFFKGFLGEDKFGLKEIKDSLIAVIKPLTDAIGEFFKSVDWVAVGAGMRSVFDVLVNVGKIVGSVLIGAINLAIGIFNVLVATGTALYRIIDYLLAPFGGIADVIIGPLTNAFNSIVSLLTETIIPWFNSLGEKLSGFAAWIDSSTQVIQGPLKFALDFLRSALIGVGIVFGIQKGIIIVQNGLMALRSMWETIAIAGLIAWDLVVVAGTALMGALGTAMAFLLSPIGLAIIAIGLVVLGFKALYDSGWSFSTALEAVGDNLKRFGLAYTDIWLSIAEKVASFFGGSEAITAAREKIKAEQKELDAREAARDAERASTREERNREEPASRPAFSLSQIPDVFSGGTAASPTSPQGRSAPPGPQARDAATNPAASNPPAAPPAAPLPTPEQMAASMRPPSGPGGASTDSATLNNNLQLMVRNLREISDNTKRTADLLASNGNLFRR